MNLTPEEKLIMPAYLEVSSTDALPSQKLPTH